MNIQRGLCTLWGENHLDEEETKALCDAAESIKDKCTTSKTTEYLGLYIKMYLTLLFLSGHTPPPLKAHSEYCLSTVFLLSVEDKVLQGIQACVLKLKYLCRGTPFYTLGLDWLDTILISGFVHRVIGCFPMIC